jgi:hypothetical protein
MKMTKRIFKNEQHQKIFDKQGFIVLPFINENQITILNKLFDELHPHLPTGGFFSGSYSSDMDYKRKASEKIVEVFSEVYEKLFVNYTPFGAAFLYKVPGENSALAAHQDWTIVDEYKHVALNCWVPLCDVSIENGPIMILPGSHFDNFPVIRAPTLPFFFSGSDHIVEKELIPMEVKAGTAVILNQSVIHYSPPNRGKTVRKAITAGIKSQGAQMYFHYKVPGKDELEVFEMDDDFLISFKDFANDILQRPYLGKSIGFIPYQLPQLQGKELYCKLKEMKEKAGYTMNSIYEEIPPSAPENTADSWLKKITHKLRNWT